MPEDECLADGAEYQPVYNIVLRLDLATLEWQMIDNYGDIPGVRMGECDIISPLNPVICWLG